MNRFLSRPIVKVAAISVALILIIISLVVKILQLQEDLDLARRAAVSSTQVGKVTIEGNRTPLASQMEAVASYLSWQVTTTTWQPGCQFPYELRAPYYKCLEGFLPGALPETSRYILALVKETFANPNGEDTSRMELVLVIYPEHMVTTPKHTIADPPPGEPGDYISMKVYQGWSLTPDQAAILGVWGLVREIRDNRIGPQAK